MRNIHRNSAISGVGVMNTRCRCCWGQNFKHKASKRLRDKQHKAAKKAYDHELDNHEENAEDIYENPSFNLDEDFGG